MRKQLLREWKKIDMEAADAGLTDKGEIKRLLRNEDEVDELYRSWWSWIVDFENAASKFIKASTVDNKEQLMKVYQKAHQCTDQVNRRFIALCLEAYERELRVS
jgi:hypothetical protein